MQTLATSTQQNLLQLRLIDSGPLNAAANMAIDEALATFLAQRRNCNYLRFYRWQPAAMSFGYNQRLDRLVDLEAVARSGLGIVRRMSGGKMVFHADEHTFSMGLTAEFIKSATGNTATFLDMFRFAVEPMVAALVRQGVPARFSSAREMAAGRSNHLHCYAAAAGHSIFAGQHKLIGAAGVFRGDCLIIHGSIPISIVLPPDELFTADHKSDAAVDMAALSDYLDHQKIKTLPEVIAEVYAEKFASALIRKELDDEETSLADKLAAEKYTNLNWPQTKSPNQG